MALAREPGLTWLGRWALLNLARVAIEQHDMQRAKELYEQSLAMFQAMDLNSYCSRRRR